MQTSTTLMHSISNDLFKFLNCIKRLHRKGQKQRSIEKSGIFDPKFCQRTSDDVKEYFYESF